MSRLKKMKTRFNNSAKKQLARVKNSRFQAITIRLPSGIAIFIPSKEIAYKIFKNWRRAADRKVYDTFGILPVGLFGRQTSMEERLNDIVVRECIAEKKDSYLAGKDSELSSQPTNLVRKSGLDVGLFIILGIRLTLILNLYILFNRICQFQVKLNPVKDVVLFNKYETIKKIIRFTLWAQYGSMFFQFPVYELHAFGLFLYMASMISIGVLHYRFNALPISVEQSQMLMRNLSLLQPNYVWPILAYAVAGNFQGVPYRDNLFLRLSPSALTELEGIGREHGFLRGETSTGVAPNSAPLDCPRPNAPLPTMPPMPSPLGNPAPPLLIEGINPDQG